MATFHGKAYFLGNGQYDADASGYEPSNEDGGALFNSGTMTVGTRMFRLFLGVGPLSTTRLSCVGFSFCTPKQEAVCLLSSSLLYCWERALLVIFFARSSVALLIFFAISLGLIRFNKSWVPRP